MRPYGRVERLRRREAMTLESVVGLVITILILAYLVFTLLRPEKF